MLAVHWAHRHASRFPDGIYLAQLCGDNPTRLTTPHELLGEVLHALGIQTANIPASRNQRQALYQNLVARRRMLIILDHAAHVSQIQPLLPDSAGPVLLVTGRDLPPDFGDIGRIQLGVLPPGDALIMFKDHIGVDRTEEEQRAAIEVVRLYRYLPLMIAIMGALLTSTPAVSISLLVQWLEKAVADATIKRGNEDPKG